MQFQQLQQRSPRLCTNLIWEQLWTQKKHLKNSNCIQYLQDSRCQRSNIYIIGDY